jgi:hypothetical protein
VIINQITGAYYNIMSSAWERSRRIPWCYLDQTPAAAGESINYEAQRERILSTLARERAVAEEEYVAVLREKKLANESDGSRSNDSATATTKVNQQEQQPSSDILGKLLSWNTAIPYSTAELIRQTAFGVCMGSITGAVFGFMDGIKHAGESDVLKKASNAAKGKFILQGTSRAGFIFGGFFGGFHMTKYGIRVLADPGDYAEIALAGSLSMGVMALRPITRASLPYAAMLIAMDTFHIYFNKP